MAGRKIPKNRRLSGKSWAPCSDLRFTGRTALAAAGWQFVETGDYFNRFAGTQHCISAPFDLKPNSTIMDEISRKFPSKTNFEIRSALGKLNLRDEDVFKNISFSIIATYWQETEHTFLGKKKTKHISHAGFYVRVDNRSLHNIEIDWNKTLYFEDGFIKNNFSLKMSVCSDLMW